MRKKIAFAIDFVTYALTGGFKYYAWLLVLGFFVLMGAFTAYEQFTKGLIITGVTQQFSWELYIVNFVFLVGVAAAAVTVVFPAYVYKHKSMLKVVVLGEIVAIVAVPLCITFILFHMGRPDRLWHILPGIGIFNIPFSMLDWDVIALNGYLAFNIVGVFYYLYKRYSGGEVNKTFYMPLIFLSIPFALSIHTLTAFILNTMPAIPMWATSVMPIRFIATAFAAGPSLIIIIFLIINKTTKLEIDHDAIELLAQVVVWCLGLSLFLTMSEAITELYPGTEHSTSLQYLMFGLHGMNKLVPWYWASVALMVGAFIMLLSPSIRKHHERHLPLGCAMAFVGVWIEKGMTLVIPAFNPTPIGEFAEYTVSWVEISNTLGIWAGGFIALTLLMKGAIGVLTGDLRYAAREGESYTPAGDEGAVYSE